MSQELVFNIISTHVLEISKLIESKLFSFCYNLSNDEFLIIQNLNSETSISILYNMLENILNYMHHSINNRIDENLNLIFDEIRNIMLIHNSCVINKYVFIFQQLYNYINRTSYSVSSLDEYIDDLTSDINTFFSINKNLFIDNIIECGINCKTIYDPSINPIKFNISNS